MKKRALALALVLSMVIPLIGSTGIIAYAIERADAQIISTAKKELMLWYDEEAPYGNEELSIAYKGANAYKDIADDGWEKWSLPLGNGYSGINVFGRTDTERIQITDNTLSSQLVSVAKIDGTDYFGGGLNNFSETYLDFGHSHNDVTSYKRALDLRRAVSTVNYTYNGVDYSREYFTSYPDKAIVIYLAASGEGNLNFTLRPTIPYEQDYMVKEGDGFSKHGTVVANDDGTITLSGNLGYNDVDFVGRYKVINNGGTITAANGADEDGMKDNGTLTVNGANSAYIVMTLSTNYELSSDIFTTAGRTDKLSGSTVDAAATAEAELSAALNYTYEELRERHIADYDNLFGRVDVDLGGMVPSITTDELLENYINGEYDAYLEELYFQFGRYLLISSSREGTLPANLQGTWNRYNLASWGSGYWHNINVQMNYWPAFSTNLAETFGSYVDFWEAFLPKAQMNATGVISGELYNANLDKDGGNGWTIGVGSQALEVSSAPGCGNIGFTTQMFWDYYDFTRDKAILEDTVYPALKGASQFITKTFAKEDDGTYLSIRGDSPEQWVDGVWYYTKGTTYDQSFAYTNGYYTLEAAKILGIEPTDAGESILATIEAQLPSYDPIVVGYSGQVKEFREESYYGELGEYAHRHISQLVGLYPGNLINSSTPAWIDAAKYTLSQREMGTAGDTWGWSIAHRQNLWARAGDGDEAYRQYQKLLTMRTATNLWSKTPAGFQIDGNFGGTAGVAEMLLQSQSGYIEPLAAIPSEWKTGAYTGLVARGNFEVSARWEDGNAKVFNVTSNSGGVCKIKHDGLAGAVVLGANGSTVNHTQISDDAISFMTEAGETYIICNLSSAEKVEAPEMLTVASMGKNDYSLNWSASADAVKYNVYKAKENESDYTFVGSTAATGYVYTTNEDEENKRMTYRVCAVSASGAQSDGALAYVNPVKTDIVSVDVRKIGNKLQFAIDTEGTFADLYRVYERLSDGTYKMVAESKLSVIALDEYDLNKQYAITTVCGYFESEKINAMPDSQNIFGNFETNALLHKPVIYEGLGIWSASYSADKVTDGITYANRETVHDGRFSSQNSDNVTPSTFIIELGGLYELDELTIDNYDSVLRYTSIKVDVLRDGSWISALDTTVSEGKQTLSYSLNGAIGEKIRITLLNTVNSQAITVHEFMCSGTRIGESYEPSVNVFVNKPITTLDTSTEIYSTYEIGKLTDGITSTTRHINSPHKYGRFAIKNAENNYASFVIELDGVYMLDTLTIDRFNSTTFSYVKIELYYNGEWTTAIEDSKGVTDAFLTNTVYSIGSKMAERVRMTVQNNSSADGVTIQEILCSGKRVCDSRYYGNVLSRFEADDYTGPAALSGYEIYRLTDGLSQFNWEHHSKGRFSSGFASAPSVSVVYPLDGIYSLDTFNMEIYSGSSNPVNKVKIELFCDGEWIVAHEGDYGAQKYYYIDLGGGLASKIRLTFAATSTASNTITINEAMICGERVREFDRASSTASLDALLAKAVISGDGGYINSARTLAALVSRTIADKSFDKAKVNTALERADNFASLELGDVLPSDIIFDYKFGADTKIPQASGYPQFYAENDAGASNYKNAASALSYVQVRNAASAFGIVSENGNYVLKRGNATNGTNGNYVNFYADCDGAQPSHLARYSDAGRSFVFAFDIKAVDIAEEMSLLQFITRASSATVFASILKMTSSGEIYAWKDSGKTVITTVSPDEYTRISVLVNPSVNKFYVYVNGTNKTPEGCEFLTSAQMESIEGTYDVGGESITLGKHDFVFGEARILEGKMQNAEVYVDNVTAYYVYENTCDNHGAGISAAQVSIGESIAVKYYVSACEHMKENDYSMRFSMNGRQVEVNEYTTAADGRLVFTFFGIAPQCMGDNVTAELMLDGAVIAEKSEYSVKANLTSLLSKESTSDELKALIYDMLIYGAASQRYVNYKTDSLVTDGVEGVSPSAHTPERSDTALTASSSAGVSIKGAGVFFDFNNRIYVKLKADDITGVKVLFDDEELEIEKLENGDYVAYSDAIFATSFSTVYTFTLKVGENTVQTLEYSVNSYAFAKHTQVDTGGNPTMMAELALALYRYGSSAKNYLNAD